MTFVNSEEFPAQGKHQLGGRRPIIDSGGERDYHPGRFEMAA
ncbi:MAG: hypothetical protein ABGZ31_00945 [Roseibacillus sp.]